MRSTSAPAPLWGALAAGARHARATPALGCLALCSLLAGPFIALADRIGLRLSTSRAAVALALALGGVRLAYPHLVNALRGDAVARLEASDGPVAAR